MPRPCISPHRHLDHRDYSPIIYFNVNTHGYLQSDAAQPNAVPLVSPAVYPKPIMRFVALAVDATARNLFAFCTSEMGDGEIPDICATIYRRRRTSHVDTRVPYSHFRRRAVIRYYVRVYT